MDLARDGAEVQRATTGKRVETVLWLLFWISGASALAVVLDFVLLFMAIGRISESGLTNAAVHDLLDSRRSELESLVVLVRERGVEDPEVEKLSQRLGFLDIAYDKLTDRVSHHWGHLESLAGTGDMYLERLTAEDGRRRAGQERDGGECERVDQHWWFRYH